VQPAAEALRLYGDAALKGHGLLEPFYRLHAGRLRALLPFPTTAAILQVGLQ
jgi:hypothetical protein